MVVAVLFAVTVDLPEDFMFFDLPDLLDLLGLLPLGALVFLPLPVSFVGFLDMARGKHE